MKLLKNVLRIALAAILTCLATPAWAQVVLQDTDGNPVSSVTIRPVPHPSIPDELTTRGEYAAYQIVLAAPISNDVCVFPDAPDDSPFIVVEENTFDEVRNDLVFTSANYSDPQTVRVFTNVNLTSNMSYPGEITHRTTCGALPAGPALTVDIRGWPDGDDDNGDGDDDEPVPVPALPPTATVGLFAILTGISLRARRVGR